MNHPVLDSATVVLEPWLGPMRELLAEERAEEALALAEFYPATSGRRLVEVAALMLLRRYDDAARLAEQELDARTVAPAFGEVLEGLPWHGMKLVHKVLAWQSDAVLTTLCVEGALAQGRMSPGEAAYRLIRLVERAPHARDIGQFERVLRRAFELDGSPNRLLEAATAVLRLGDGPLAPLAHEAIERALPDVGSAAAHIVLRLVELLHVRDVERALVLLDRAVRGGSVRLESAAKLLVPLIPASPWALWMGKLLVRWGLGAEPRLVAPALQALLDRVRSGGDWACVAVGLALAEQAGPEAAAASPAGTRAILDLLLASGEVERYASWFRRDSYEVADALALAEHLVKGGPKALPLIQRFFPRAMAGPAERMRALLRCARWIWDAYRDGSPELAEGLEDMARQEVRGPLEVQALGWHGNNRSVLRVVLRAVALGEDLAGMELLRAVLEVADSGEIAEAAATTVRDYADFTPRGFGLTMFPMLQELMSRHDANYYALRLRIAELPSEYRTTLDVVLAAKTDTAPPRSPDLDIPSFLGRRETEPDPLEPPAPAAEAASPEATSAFAPPAPAPGAPESPPVASPSEYTGIVPVLVPSPAPSQPVAAAAEPPTAAPFGKRTHSGNERDTVTVARHTRVELPSACTLREPVTLRVQLVRAKPAGSAFVRPIRFRVRQGLRKLTFDVHVTAPGFTLTRSLRRVSMPILRDSPTIEFSLTPVEPGEQQVEIEFFHEGRRAGYVTMRTVVVAAAGAGAASPAKPVLLEDPVDTVTLADDPGAAESRTLHVTWKDAEGVIAYTIHAPAGEKSESWEHPCPGGKPEIERALRELNAFLGEVVSYGDPTPERWNDILLNMRAKGQALFEVLVPEEVAARVRAWPRGCTVRVDTNEQLIPWEILWADGDFWGERFVLARTPRLQRSRSAPESDRAGAAGPCRLQRLVNVIGGDLPAADVDRLQALFGALPMQVGVATLFQKSISQLNAELRGAQALHLTCHGHLEPFLLQVADTREQTRNLLPDTVRVLELRPGSLVFANACASSAPVLTFGRFTTFGWEFYRHGAATFVGTLGPVPISYAVDFAAAVYAELFRAPGSVTIGQALAAARQAAAPRHNLFWLLYCLYGDPDLRLDLRPAS